MGLLSNNPLKVLEIDDVDETLNLTFSNFVDLFKSISRKRLRYFRICLFPSIANGVSGNELKDLDTHFTKFLKNSDLHYFWLWLLVKDNRNKSDYLGSFKHIPDHI